MTLFVFLLKARLHVGKIQRKNTFGKLLHNMLPPFEHCRLQLQRILVIMKKTFCLGTIHCKLKEMYSTFPSFFLNIKWKYRYKKMIITTKNIYC